MATLYIHIGTPKTGSTSIQNFLKMNEQALEQSIYQKGFDIIQQYAKNAEKLVITEESIWIRQYRRKDFWHNVKKDAKEAGCDIKVIVYIRRQDLYAQALWNQSVKYVPIRVPRMGKTFSEFLKSKAFEDRHADYYQTLSEIAQCIGKENIIVRVFEKEMFIRSKCGIYEDFMNAIGLLRSRRKQKRTAGWQLNRDQASD